MISPMISNIFTPNKECIVNSDLDGLLSGMLLQKYLNWKIVGYSSCTGTTFDNIWFCRNANLGKCVFVDLPVIHPKIEVIDQHFISLNGDSLNTFNSYQNKINPNLMRGRRFDKNQYYLKYPFGTVHFVMAVLENLNYFTDTIDLNKTIDDFKLIDLICRADRVVGNYSVYTDNCTDWMKWLIDIGDVNTINLFNQVQTNLEEMIESEKRVETKLLSFGCAGKDGDCSNLFKNEDYLKLISFFDFLSNSLSLPPLPMFKLCYLNRLVGKRIDIDDLTKLENEIKQENIFSYAFVSKNVFSVTYSKRK